VKRAAALFACAAGLAGALPAAAHTRSVSYSSWKLDASGATVSVRIPLLELSRLAFDPVVDVGSGGRAAEYLATHLTLRAGDALCAATGTPTAAPAPKGWAHFRWRVACAASGPRSVESAVLLDVAPSHLHFARVRGADGKVTERVLAEGDEAWALDGGSAAAGAGTSFLGYVGLGLEHIVTGWDHLAFLGALLLLAHTLREVATLVTAFTLAHSVTLALAALGLVRPDAVAVESLIGFSIALVAAENAWLLAGRDRTIPAIAIGLLLAMAALAALGVGSLRPLALLGLGLFSLCHFALLDGATRPARLRAAIAFAFGLVHGFGFAGILAEMELPADRLVHALVGFNVGVELGQLAVVAMLWPLLRLLARWQEGRVERLVAEAGSAAICGIGLFWFLTRAFG
jgi:hypothetical protein